MFTLFRNLIGYSGTSNMDSYIVYGAISLSIIFFVVIIDLTYRLIRSFIRK